MKTPTPWPRFRNLAAAVVFAVSAYPTTPMAAQPWSDQPQPPHELIVLLAPAAEAPSVDQVAAGVASRKGLDPAFLAGNPLRARPAVTQDLGSLMNLSPDHPRARLARYVVLEYPQDTNLDHVMGSLARNANVLHVEKNVLFQLSSVTFNDPLIGDQWGHAAFNLPNAWSREKGHAYIGLIDQGLNVNHPDLRPFSTHVVAGTYCGYSGTTYEGGNFRPQHSWNFLNAGCNVDETGITYRGHGTHVAGIVGATANNSTGVAGVCPGCNLMMARANLNSTNSIVLTSAASSLVFLTDHGVQAVSMSWGIPGQTCVGAPNGGLALFCQALAYAEERDVALMAAPGNDKNLIEFPASDSRVLSIGGLESDGSFWDRANDPGNCPCAWPSASFPECSTNTTFECGSNFTSGSADDPDTQDLVAPAKEVVSTLYAGYDSNPFLGCGHTSLPSGYGPCTGTSMASPYAAGAVGLLRSANPLLTKAQIRDALVTNASRATTWDYKLGYGVPDLDASLVAALGTAGGEPVRNRLTPLFVLNRVFNDTHVLTTVPQVASAMVLHASTTYRQYADEPVLSPPVGYLTYPGAPCESEPCDSLLARASVYLFTSDAAPWAGAPALIPLYRMSYKGAWSSAFYYATTQAELEAKSTDYQLEGIEGYLLPRPGSGSTCPIEGTTKLLRLRKSSLNDYALMPESEETAYRNAGYGSESGFNDWVGCVYPNTDADGDQVVDGFEDVAGSNPLEDDTDCDGQTDGAEILQYDSDGYGDPLVGSCLTLNRHIFDSFTTGSGGLNGRTTEVGGATWSAEPAAILSGGAALDSLAIGGVPVNPASYPASSTFAVSADLDPLTSEWVGTGFASGYTTPYWSAGQLWALVRSTGTYVVWAGGVQLASGTIPGSPVGGFHNVKVQYTPQTLSAAAWINGVQVYTGTLGASFVIGKAGFHMHKSGGGGGKIDNFSVSVGGTPVISDSFGGSGVVNGRATDVGSVTWTAGVLVVSGGRALDSDAIGGAPFDPLALPGNPTVAVVGDVNPVACEWGGLGFSQQANTAYWSAGQLWALVRSTGTYAVFAGGAQVASGNIPGTPVNGFHRIKVQFTPSSKKAVVSLNGTQVYSQTLSATLDIHYAGFHFYRSASTGGLDNFEVLATSAP